MDEPHHIAPIASRHRIVGLDAVRGFALVCMGLLLAPFYFYPDAVAVSPVDPSGDTDFVFEIWGANWVLLEGKVLLVFGMVLACGYEIRRILGNGHSPSSLNWHFLRRCLAIAILGVIHVALVTSHDVLLWLFIASLLYLAARNISHELMILAGVYIITLSAIVHFVIATGYQSYWEVGVVALALPILLAVASRGGAFAVFLLTILVAAGSGYRIKAAADLEVVHQLYPEQANQVLEASNDESYLSFLASMDNAAIIEIMKDSDEIERAALTKTTYRNDWLTKGIAVRGGAFVYSLIGFAQKGLPVLFGCMLIAGGLIRWGIFEESRIGRLAGWGSLLFFIGLGLEAGSLWLAMYEVGGLHFYLHAVGTVTMALGGAGVAMYLANRLQRVWFVRSFAWLGRYCLSIYLTFSGLLVFLVARQGLYAASPRTEIYLWAAGAFISSVLIVGAWNLFFRVGPFERFVRTLTYMRIRLSS